MTEFMLVGTTIKGKVILRYCLSTKWGELLLGSRVQGMRPESHIGKYGQLVWSLYGFGFSYLNS